jgi:hypothetical protein
MHGICITLVYYVLLFPAMRATYLACLYVCSLTVTLTTFGVVQSTNHESPHVTFPIVISLTPSLLRANTSLF